MRRSAIPTKIAPTPRWRSGLSPILAGAILASVIVASAHAGAQALPPPQPTAYVQPKGMPGHARGPAPDGSTLVYFYADAYEYVDANEISGEYTQHAPTIGTVDWHSLAEIAAQSADGLDIVEIGWIVTDTDPQPQLFVFHWIRGAPTCYNGCGYVQLSQTRVPGMHVDVTDTPQSYAIHYSGGDWYVGYQGEWIGYFPGSEWNGDFTSVGLAQWFGEVAAGTTLPCTQMGSGAFAAEPGAASISNLRVDGDAAESLPGELTLPAAYTTADMTDTSYNYGGPGRCWEDVIFGDGFD
jgi:neprosin-like protein